MVIFGGQSGEHEVSLMSAASVMGAINKEKYHIIPVGIAKNGDWKLFNGSVEEIESGDWEQSINELTEKGEDNKKFSLLPLTDGKQGIVLQNGEVKKIDVIFPVLHGPYGEDGRIQGLFEMIDIPYVGCGVMASAVAMDKVITKKVLEAEKIAQTPYQVIYGRRFQLDPLKYLNDLEATFEYPVFVKPANMGSSVGISKAKNREALKIAIKEAGKYDNKIVIEAFVEGREIECAVLGNEAPRVALPAEIIPSHEFYDYHDKYFDGTSRYVIPPDLSEELIQEIQHLAIQTYELLDCRGLSRIDFFVENETNRVLVNEVNTMPGFTKISMYPKMWEATGLPYDKLIDELIQLAMEEYQLKSR